MMTKNRKAATFFAAIIALSTAVSGCSTLQYDQGSVSPAQFEKDKAFCEMEANKTVAGREDAHGEIYGSVYDPCMRSKGYVRSKK